MDLQYMKMQILEIGLLILAAYFGGKIARKLKIGEVIGQILGGILIGPHFLEVIHRLLVKNSELESNLLFKPIYHFYSSSFQEYAAILESYHFFVFLFLGIVAFSLGEELHRDRLRQLGVKPVIICIIQAILTWAILSLGFRFIFRFTIINSLLIGSIGIATAPALTFILMSKLKIEGKLKNILANIVVLDDIIEVIVFSITLGVAMAMKRGGHISIPHLVGEVGLELGLAIVIGFAIFVVLKFTIKKNLLEDEPEREDSFLSTILPDHPTPSIEILFIIFGVIALGISLAIHFDLPFLITAVVAGFLISNFHSSAVFDSLKLKDVMPLFNLLFFAIIGASVRIESFNKSTIIFVAGYFVFRTLGKLLGNWIGCKITKQDPKITASLPRLMLPQAGMAAVETILVAKLLVGYGGMIVFNTIIPALVLFELIGAYVSEKTLLKWKNWTTGESDAIKNPGEKLAGIELAVLFEERVLDFSPKSHIDCIDTMTDLLYQQQIVPEVFSLISALKEREKLGSTVIGDGVAIPHCKSDLVSRVYGICGFLKKPISWNGSDEHKVHTVILLISPKDDPDAHLDALRTVSRALTGEEIDALKLSAKKQVNSK